MSLAPSRILGHDNWSVIYEFMNDKIGYQRYIFYNTILSCFLSLVNFLDSSQVQASFLLALQENYSPLLPVGFSSAMLKFLCLVVLLFYNTTSLSFCLSFPFVPPVQMLVSSFSFQNRSVQFLTETETSCVSIISCLLGEFTVAFC